MRYTVYEKYSGRAVLKTNSFDDASMFIRQHSQKTYGKYTLYDSKLNTFDVHKIKNSHNKDSD